jgi:serine/threonine-protein kinase
MADLSAEQFAHRAYQLGLVNDRQLSEVWGQHRGEQLSGEEFLQHLLRRDFLTNFQADRLKRGERSGYFYGDYKVLYMVGTGTFARVYRAVHRNTGDVVALKVLRRKLSDNAEEADRFCREGKMGSSLRHPNIVPIYEVGKEDVGGDVPIPYLTMEFVEGRNLREFVRVHRNFEPLEATRLIAEVADGLHYASLRGIYHRDLKLSNVLVSSRGQAKLVDFGLANVDASSEEETASNPRTIEYASLERATGVRKDDSRSDIYFLGSMYYHLLSGLSPWPDRSQRQSKTRFEDVIPIQNHVPNLPRILVTAVQRAMHLNPMERYQTPGEFRTDLLDAAARLNQPGGESAAPAPVAPAPIVGPQAGVMVLEANPSMQDLFREKLKSKGFRVLVTRDPDRALARFKDHPRPADCILISTGDLGEEGFRAFNRLGDLPETSDLPALLLLGERQRDWAKHAKLAKHRRVMVMPVKVRELRQALMELTPNAHQLLDSEE